MSKEKDAIIAKIRALLSKTTGNGCTEAESMLAAEKASHMMDQYDIQTLDLQEKSTFTEMWRENIKHDILKRNIASIAAKYSGCYILYYGTKMRMMGRDIDMLMAEWLFDTLVAHVTKGLRDHMSGYHLHSSLFKTARKNGFILGAINRLFERVNEMLAVRVVQSNALVLCREGEAKDAMYAKLEEEGSKVGKSRKSRTLKAASNLSYSDGQKCGDKASLSHQVS